MSDQTKHANPRLIINGVEGSLQGSRLPPASSALVRQQIEAYEGIGAIFGEGYQVTEGTIEKKITSITQLTFIATWSLLMLPAGAPLVKGGPPEWQTWSDPCPAVVDGGVLLLLANSANSKLFLAIVVIWSMDLWLQQHLPQQSCVPQSHPHAPAPTFFYKSLKPWDIQFCKPTVCDVNIDTWSPLWFRRQFLCVWFSLLEDET